MLYTTHESHNVKQVEGTVVKTSPPGPVKNQPKDLRA